MTLAAGTRLGPYEILSPIGAGGMGEVYRARDTRLGRDVAVKVLPEEVATDPKALARFEKEARAVAALSHPNILALHDVGTEGLTSYVVTELLEGTTLREHLARGPLPLKNALDVAIQMAEGLAAAHGKGIVHRDVKPENVFLTKDGHVKLLDFGLARHDVTRHDPADTRSPTLAAVSEKGVVLGTVAYMSPEQARGEVVDFRTDQFSLGTVLYEMLAGTRPFQGGSAPETLAAIIRDEPEPLEKRAPKVPAPVRWIVDRCLAKEPVGRYDSTRDLARDLVTCGQHLSETTSGAAAALGPGARPLGRKSRTLLLTIPGAAALVVLGLFVGRTLTLGSEKQGPVTFRRLTFPPVSIANARFAPDGNTVVYSASIGSKPVELFSVRLDTAESTPLGIQKAIILSVSSRGELAVLLKERFLHTFQHGAGTLARVPLGGAAPRAVAEKIYRADWSPDGTDLAVIPERSAGKDRLEYPLGKVLYETTGHLSDVRISPTGDFVAFKECDAGGCVLLLVGKNGEKRTLGARTVGTGGGLAWRADGEEIVFEGGSSLSNGAIRSITLSGRERILLPTGGLLILRDVHPDGRVLATRFAYRIGMAALSPGAERERDLSWPGNGLISDISPDGSMVLFGTEERGVYVRKTDGSLPVRLGEGSPSNLSPDGKWVLALSAGTPKQLSLVPTGAGAPRTVHVEGVVPSSASICPDGRTLIVAGTEPGKEPGAYVVPITGGKPRQILAEVPSQSAAVSPDSKFFAVMDREGKGKIVSLGGGPARPLSGVEPEDVLARWSADGRYLYAAQPGDLPAKIFRVEIDTGRRELWKELMPTDPSGVNRFEWIAISPDGRSFAYSYMRIMTSDLYVIEGLK